MKVLITGICGFVGSSLARWLIRHDSSVSVAGIDNFIRPGSEMNRLALKKLGISVRHGDVRNASDLDTLPASDWVIDAAANPSVLAGVDGTTNSRQLLEHNLHGTINILEYCKRVRSGFVLLSTSRVYSIRALAGLSLVVRERAFMLDPKAALPDGVSENGIGTTFSTAAPLSLYGSTKLASEILALEYAETFSLPVWINRCGVLAGAGQFGTAEQGIFSFWIHACARGKPLRYIGYEGKGYQVRDALHPDDLAELVHRQMTFSKKAMWRVFNVGGGLRSAMSLAQLTGWCAERFGKRRITADKSPRQFDIPWFVMDSADAAGQLGWRPRKGMEAILKEIAEHAERNPGWLEITGAA